MFCVLSHARAGKCRCLTLEVLTRVITLQQLVSLQSEGTHHTEFDYGYDSYEPLVAPAETDHFAPVSIRKNWYYMMLCDYIRPIPLSHITRLPLTAPSPCSPSPPHPPPPRRPRCLPNLLRLPHSVQGALLCSVLVHCVYGEAGRRRHEREGVTGESCRAQTWDPGCGCNDLGV